MEPVIPTYLLLAWLVAVLVLLGMEFWRGRRISIRHRLAMASLEGLAIASSLLLVLRPTKKIRTPRPGAYRLAVLADQSRSMTTINADGLSRLTRLENSLTSLTPEMRRLFASVRTEFWGFSDTCHLRGENMDCMQGLAPLHGMSAPGDALAAVMHEARRGLPLGTVLLLSDGHANAGRPLTEVAKQCQAQGLPVSCVLYGEEQPGQDASITFATLPQTLQRDVSANFQAVITATFPTPQTGKVTFAEDGTPLQTQDITLPPGQNLPVSFQHTPRTSGFHIYSVTLESIPGDSRSDNNTDFVAIEVSPPPVTKVLLLAGGLDWEARFLRQFASHHEEFQLSSIVRMAKDHFARTGVPTPPDGPPGFHLDTATLEQQDVVILDTRAIPFFSTAETDVLRAFVEHKGGGLLMHGPIGFLKEADSAGKSPHPLAELLPMHETALLAIRSRTLLATEDTFILDKDDGGIFSGSPGAFLPASTTLFVPARQKKAARVALVLADSSRTPILTGIAFGAGRVAFAGIENTWRWCLANETAVHLAFWRALLLWLGEAGQPRLRMLNRAAVASVGDDFVLDLAVQGEDFQPAAAAQVKAQISTPSGQRRELSLEPQLTEEGRYTAFYTPEEAGGYTVNFVAAVDGRELTLQTAFAARFTSPELLDTQSNEALLRDVARITGGSFFTPKDLATATSLPLSARLPMEESVIPLFSPWWLLSIFTLSTGLLWWFRRRIGLK